MDTLVNPAEDTGIGDEDEPTNQQILENLREAMQDTLAGRTRPADEVIAEIRKNALSICGMSDSKDKSAQ